MHHKGHNVFALAFLLANRLNPPFPPYSLPPPCLTSSHTPYRSASKRASIESSMGLAGMKRFKQSGLGGRKGRHGALPGSGGPAFKLGDDAAGAAALLPRTPRVMLDRSPGANPSALGGNGAAACGSATKRAAGTPLGLAPGPAAAASSAGAGTEAGGAGAAETASGPRGWARVRIEVAKKSFNACEEVAKATDDAHFDATYCKITFTALARLYDKQFQHHEVTEGALVQLERARHAAVAFYEAKVVLMIREEARVTARSRHSQNRSASELSLMFINTIGGGGGGAASTASVADGDASDGGAPTAAAAAVGDVSFRSGAGGAGGAGEGRDARLSREAIEEVKADHLIERALAAEFESLCRNLPDPLALVHQARAFWGHGACSLVFGADGEGWCGAAMAWPLRALSLSLVFRRVMAGVETLVGYIRAHEDLPSRIAHMVREIGEPGKI